MDFMALTWNMDQSDADDGDSLGATGNDGDGPGGVKGVAMDATLWMRGNEPFGNLTNCSSPLTFEIVS